MYEVPAQERRRAVVTGASSGLGQEIARRLALAGAEVVLAVRSIERGEKAAAVIRASRSDAHLEVRLVDLADLASVHAFCDALLEESRPVHLLANNAGVMRPPRRTESVDAMELQFATNVAGPYVLTARLLARLAESGGARVGWMSSSASVVGRLDFDDLQSRTHYRPLRAYAQSKLADLALAQWMARRAVEAGWPLFSVAAHPGFVRTNLFSAGASIGRRRPRHSWLESRWLPSQGVDDGAEPLLYALTSPDALNGGYYGPCGPLALVGPSAPARVPRRAAAPADAQRLIEALVALTGVEMTL